MMTAAALLIAADLFIAIRAQDLQQVEDLLAGDQTLASKEDENGASPVSVALGLMRDKESFLPRKDNRILDAILRRNPPLSPFELAAVGTAWQVRSLIAVDALKKFHDDPKWNDYVLFHEYFHGDNGAGLGASHQTGWTALVAKLIDQAGRNPASLAAEGRSLPTPV